MSNVKALKYLYPDAEFVITDDDLTTIVWHTEGLVTPTVKQIKDATKAMELEAANVIATKQAARASAIAKLEALGLNLDEAQAVIGQ